MHRFYFLIFNFYTHTHTYMYTYNIHLCITWNHLAYHQLYVSHHFGRFFPPGVVVECHRKIFCPSQFIHLLTEHLSPTVYLLEVTNENGTGRRLTSWVPQKSSATRESFVSPCGFRQISGRQLTLHISQLQTPVDLVRLRSHRGETRESGAVCAKCWSPANRVAPGETGQCY